MKEKIFSALKKKRVILVIVAFILTTLVNFGVINVELSSSIDDTLKGIVNILELLDVVE